MTIVVIWRYINKIKLKLKLLFLRADFVTIQADETTDVSAQTQLVPVLRYIDSNHDVQERIFEFLPVVETTSESIANCI